MLSFFFFFFVSNTINSRLDTKLIIIICNDNCDDNGFDVTSKVLHVVLQRDFLANISYIKSMFALNVLSV